MGVYQEANWSTKRVALDLLSAPSSMSSRILETVLSLYSRLTKTTMEPSLRIVPAFTSSFNFFSTGIASPVKEDISRCPLPSMIVPSAGKISPTRTKTLSPIWRDFGSTSFVDSPETRWATLARSPTASRIALWDLASATSSNNSPIWNKNMTAMPSMNSLASGPKARIAKAPTEAIIIRNSSLKTWCSLTISSMASIKTS